MKLESGSTVDDAPRWEEPSEDFGGRCRRHVSSTQPLYSVCPFCLRERLMRLCPDCATLRPCACLPSTSASSTASSSFSSAAGSGRGTNGSNTAGCEKISSLIASEPAFARSKSAGFALIRSGSIAIEQLERSRSVAATGVTSSKKRRWKWAAIWPFKGSNEKGGKESKWWYFPSPIRVFTHRKSVSRGGIY